MRAQIADELIQLTPAEKRELGEALIASADAASEVPPLSDAQRAELRRRLADHRANPNAPGITIDELKAQLRAGRA
ncbi:MAG: addiction module protein [Rubrivivax sp.]